MDMQRLFIGGSKRLKEIEGKRSFEVIDAAMQNGFEILVGDCQGVDTIVQKYLLKHGYKNVTVYASGTRLVRHNEGGWPVKHVVLDSSLSGGYDFYRQKDVQMITDCDCALLIWDGESRGTKQNIIDLKASGKPVEVTYKGRLTEGSFSGGFWKIDDEIYGFPDFEGYSTHAKLVKIWPYLKPKGCKKSFNEFPYGVIKARDYYLSSPDIRTSDQCKFDANDMIKIRSVFCTYETLWFAPVNSAVPFIPQGYRGVNK